jgi:hypothetical protein
MTRITLDRATTELLNNLSEPLEFCDETGWLLGTFTPEAAQLVEAEAAQLVEATVSAEKLHRHEVEAGLGEEISVYGYEKDLQ